MTKYYKMLALKTFIWCNERDGEILIRSGESFEGDLIAKEQLVDEEGKARLLE